MCGCSCSSHATTTPAVEATGAAFTVADMTCGHCVGTIRTALEEKMPGAAVEIDLAAKRVTVAGDAATAAAVITEAGYTPVAA